jgi:hypothetical protein
MLPDALLPARKFAKLLHERESRLFYGHWMTAKEKIKNGTAMVRCIRPNSNQQSLSNVYAFLLSRAFVLIC